MTTIGWCTDAACFSSGRQYTIRNLRESAPDDLEIIDIDPSNPRSCDGYVVHTPQIPTNLPVFPKFGLKGTRLKKRPVIMYAHQAQIQSFGADLVIYQSPLHQSLYRDGIIVPPPILERDFRPPESPEIERSNLWLYFGSFSPERGSDIAVRMAESSHQETHFFGTNIPSDSGSTPSCRFFAPVAHERVGELYASYQKLIFFPRVPIPFGRTLGESLLAGMEVTAWGRLGINSFNQPLEQVLERCQYLAANEFWAAVVSRL